MINFLKPIPLLLSVLLVSRGALADEVEVLHWWTSPGETAALGVLKQAVEKEDFVWKDFAVEGSGGRNAMTVLKSRVISGNPPTAAQIRGKGIEEWASLGLLSSIDEVAKAEDWDSKLPKRVSDTMKYQGIYVAAPVNIHRSNWLWINKKAFEKTGLPLPETWDDVFRAAPVLKKAGYIPLAFGGEPWQASTLFEVVLLGTGGVDFYRRTMINHEQEALNSEKMQDVFVLLAKIKLLFDEGSDKRTWDEASRLLIDDKAAMQVMADWAKGEFLPNEQRPGKEFLCIPAPGTEGAFIYNIDSFVMFNMPDSVKKKAQQALASLLMKPRFQVAFNIKKGAISALNMNAKSETDPCGRKSREDFVQSDKNNTLVPSVTHGMAAEERVQTLVAKVVNDFIRKSGRTVSDSDVDDAVRRLAFGINAIRSHSVNSHSVNSHSINSH